MSNLKKVLSVLTVCAMTMGMTVSALAAEQEPVDENQMITVVNLSNDISAQEIEEITNDMSASFVYEDGTVVPVETVITIEDVQTPSGRMVNEEGAKTYQVRAASKVESDSDNKNNEGVSASIHLSLTWTDVVGPNNTLDSVSGSVNVSKGTINSSSVVYGWSGFASTMETLSLGTKTSFYKSVGIKATTPTASYHVYFKGATFELNVSGTPSILD